MNMDDYYDLLGVEADAPVADIRAAYRERKAEMSQRDDDDAKADAAALNKAWNVLSDPYQRGRYDEQRAEAGGADDDERDDDVVDVPATRARTTRPPRTNTRTGQGRNARAPLQPTITLPEGLAWPAPKQRFLAMGIDALVLVVLFLVSQVLVLPAVEKSQHRADYDRYTELSQRDGLISKAHDKTNAAKKTASRNVNCDTHPSAKNDIAYCDAKAQEKKLTDERDRRSRKLAPTQQLVTGVFFLVALLYLVIPSFFGGQTLGKRLQGVRLVKLDGSRVGAGEVFRRYGALALAAFASNQLLGPVGPLVILFVATMWTRNPNRQGLQDRFARTLVVTGDAE
jgi:uncharacterized RDD family membrane protein YckC